MDFSLEEIVELLRRTDDDAELVDKLTAKSKELDATIARYSRMRNELEVILRAEKENHVVQKDDVIAVVDLPETLVAGIRFTGNYDAEYKEAEADIEACVALASRATGKVEAKDGVSIHPVPACRAVAVVHRGPYDQLSDAYRRAFDFVAVHNLETAVPSREAYVKGPGLIFPRSPKRFVTRVLIAIKD